MSAYGRGCVKTSKRNLRWEKYSTKQLPNTRLWCAIEMHRPVFANMCSAVPRRRILIAFSHSLGQKRTSNADLRQQTLRLPLSRTLRMSRTPLCVFFRFS